MSHDTELLKYVDVIANSIRVSDYIFPFDQMEQIAIYVNEQSDKYSEYGISLSFDNKDYNNHCRQFIIRICQNLNPKNEQENLYRSLINAQDKRISRVNILRLCFALKLSYRETTDFLLNYMHEPELSARSLLEFLTICCLQIDTLTRKDVHALHNEYKKIINMPASPDTPGRGMTHSVIVNDIPKITSIVTIQDYLDPDKHPEHLEFFAKTRNTQYLALFDDVPKDFTHNRADLIEQRQHSNPLSVSGYYNRLFGIHSNDGDIIENYLTRNEITALSTIYPDVFLSYETFGKLVARTRNEPISAGTYLLHLLVTIESSDQDRRHGIDFTKKNKIFEYINSAMLDAGYPSLNEANAFDKLVMDIYTKTVECNLSSENTRKVSLAVLRKCLFNIVHI